MSDHRYSSANVANKTFLDKVNQLRKLDLISLVTPQLVVVGEQSSGKNFLLDSLTGFSFSEVLGSCTQHATQISCCRGTSEKNVRIGIEFIPDGPDDVDPDSGWPMFLFLTDTTNDRLLAAIEQCIETIRAHDASAVAAAKTSNVKVDKASTENTIHEPQMFSRHLIKIKITGPEQQDLTVINIPKMCHASTSLDTTDEDKLMRNMITKYMRNDHTVLLMTLPSKICNNAWEIDEFSSMTKEADPEGTRTLGVFLLTEERTVETAHTLLKSLREWISNDMLSSGCYFIKDRGAGQGGSTDSEDLDTAYFLTHSPYGFSDMTRSEDVFGMAALRDHMFNHLMEKFFHEPSRIKSDIEQRLERRVDYVNSLVGAESSKDLNLGKISSRFQTITQCALNGQYGSEKIFTDLHGVKLRTEIENLNKKFASIFLERGHKRETSASSSHKEEVPDNAPIEATDELLRDLLEQYPELQGVAVEETYRCPEPTSFESDSIMDNLDEILHKNRGPELVTFSGTTLALAFKEQSEKWEPLMHSHVSKAIAIVQNYVAKTLSYICPDPDIHREMWHTLLRMKFLTAYKQTLKQAQSLLEIERNARPATHNPDFDAELQGLRHKRLVAAMNKRAVSVFTASNRTTPVPAVLLSDIENLAMKDNAEQMREDMFDTLVSYYNVARKRFVDAICTQAISQCLLEGENSPLKIFTPELVAQLDDEQLQDIAGKHANVFSRRKELEGEIKNLEEAKKVLRS